MPRDLMNPLLWLEPEYEAGSLDEHETAQLLNPTRIDPGAALAAGVEHEEAA